MLILNKKNSAIFITVFIISFLVISCEKEVSVTKPDPDQVYGELFINSYPEGATIFLNGKNMGRTTPDTLKWMEFGDYEIKLKKRLFYELKDSIRIDDQELVSKSYNYFDSSKVYGSFRIGSLPMPGAEIILNGVNTGYVTPHMFTDQTPGEYKVKCYMPEFRSDSLVFEISSEQKKYIYIQVDDTSQVVKFDKKITSKKIDYVYKLRIDENDDIWVSTENGGIFTCDKKNVYSYNSYNSPLPNQGINDFVFAVDNSKWFATGIGLIKFENDSWVTYNSSNSPLTTNGIYSVAVDKNNTCWIGTDDGLFSLDESGNWSVYNTSNSGLPANLITALDCNNNGEVFVGTNGSGMAKFDGTNWETYIKLESNLLTDYINIIRVVNDDQVLIGALTEPGKGAVTQGGLQLFSNNDFQNMSTPKGSNKIYDIKLYPNYIWISTGLCAYKTDLNFNYLQKIDKLTNPAIPTNSIVTFDIDQSGNIWAGTWGFGFLKIK